MAYSPQTWTDGSGGGTPITAARLGTIETGVQAAAATADSATTSVAARQPFLTPTAVKTGAYTAAASDLVLCDPSAGSFTVTLPSAPADKTRIAAKIVIAPGVNTVSVACGGTDKFNSAAGATTAVLSLLGHSLVMQYQSSTGFWFTVADDLPLPQLDTRYATPQAANPITGMFHRAGFVSIQAAINAAGAVSGGGTVWLSANEDITTGLTLPTTVPVRLAAAPGVTLRATAAMTAMISKAAGACTGIAITGLNLDGNGLADRCLQVEQALRLSIRGGIWSNCLVAVADFGLSGGQVYEMDWRDTRIVGLDESRGGATPAGMPGFGYRFGTNVTDSVIENVVIKNCAVGVQDGGNVNVHDKVHVFAFTYGASSSLNYVGTAGFRITGDINRLVNCYADTQALGFDLQGNRNTLVAPMFYWPIDYANSTGVVCINIAGSGCTVLGGTFRLPNSGLFTGSNYPVQIQTGIKPTVLVGLNVYGTAWTAVVNLVGSSNTPFAIANAWDSGLAPINLDLAGGTLTTAGANLTGAAATNRDFSWLTGTSPRWRARVDNAAEAGSGAGSNWALSSYTDAGAFGFTVAQAQRYSGMFIAARALLRLRVTQTLASAGAVTFDSFASNHSVVNLQANATSSSIGAASSLGATGMQTGQELTITWVQDATGGRTYVWPTNCRFAGGTAPADTTANTRTSVTFVYESVWCEVSRAIAVPKV